jgi:hypothetical protein
MAFGSGICVIGATVQAAAFTRHTLMGGRFLLGLGTVIVSCAGPRHVVEMAYPKSVRIIIDSLHLLTTTRYRGLLTGL